MERLHLLGPSPSDLARLPSNGLHVARPECLEMDGYPQFFKERSKLGEKVFLPAYRSYGMDYIQKSADMVGATTIILLGQPVPFSSTKKDVKKIRSLGLQAIVVLNNAPTKKMVSEYEETVEAGVDGIGIPIIHDSRGNGHGRFKFVNLLVETRKWWLRMPHYFYELENPGELSVYANCFSSLIRGGLKGFISERCYIDSRHGIHYAPGRGLLTSPIKESLEPYEHYQQYVLFDLNDETMKGFASGVLGRDLVTEFKEDTYVSRWPS